MNTQAIALDVSKQPSITPVVYIGQGDKSGTQLQASIFDNGQALTLTSYSVRLCMRLPDGESYYSVGGTVSTNVATFTIDETYAAAVEGITDIAYVEVYSGSTLICSTNRFRIVVLEGAREGASPSAAHYDEIVTAAVEAAQRADEAAQTSYAEAEAARDAAYAEAEDARDDAYAAAEAARNVNTMTAPFSIVDGALNITYYTGTL